MSKSRTLDARLLEPRARKGRLKVPWSGVREILGVLWGEMYSEKLIFLSLQNLRGHWRRKTRTEALFPLGPWCSFGEEGVVVIVVGEGVEVRSVLGVLVALLLLLQLPTGKKHHLWVWDPGRGGRRDQVGDGQTLSLDLPGHRPRHLWLGWRLLLSGGKTRVPEHVHHLLGLHHRAQHHLYLER